MERIKRGLHIWWPTLLAVTVIMFESTSFFSSEHTGHWLLWLSYWLSILTDSTLHLPWWDINLILRKVGHASGYGLASLAFLRSWRLILNEGQSNVWRRLDIAGVALALLSTLLLASADEFHQSFLPDRTSSINDVMLDFAGACLAQALLFIYARLAGPGAQPKAG